MTDRILGFQVVLLDEQSQEMERIPDVYGDDSWIVIGDYGYLLERTTEEEGPARSLLQTEAR
jgi:hypothetical protein